MEMTKENKMGTMPIGRLLLTMSGPAICSMLINSLYNIVDSIFVSHISEKALTAVTYVNPIQLLMIAVGVGTGVGLNSLIARRLGAKRFEEANEAASSGIKLGILNWIVFALVGIFFSDWFLKLFTTDAQIIEYGASYMKVITICSIFVMVSILIEKIFQATGNMIYPMVIMISGCVFNIILDPILIFGYFGMPKLGVIGAATATVTSQAIGVIVGLVFLKTRENAVKVRFLSKINWHSIKEIYSVGGPAIIMQSLNSFLIFAINGILSTFSDTAVAVLGVYGKLQSFVFMPCFGVNQGSLPIIGYNYGARDKTRMMKTFKTATITAMIIMAVGLAIFQFAPDLLLMLFNATDEMHDIGRMSLRIISWNFIPAAFSIIVTGLFQATGHGMLSMWGSVLRQFVVVLPLAYFGSKMFGITAVWAAFPIAELVGVTYFILVFRYLYKNDFKI